MEHWGKHPGYQIFCRGFLFLPQAGRFGCCR
jgi:hypothetical protein